jgi:hypothetical protein
MTSSRDLGLGYFCAQFLLKTFIANGLVMVSETRYDMFEFQEK